MSAVSVRDLVVTFGRRDVSYTAVRGVSFDVASGEIFGLVGPSGCGKTTVLRVLAGLNRGWKGEVTVLRTRLAPGQKFEGALRRNIQMVFQDPYASLHPRHRVRRTLGEPLKVLGERDVDDKVITILREVGLAPEIAL